MARTPTTIEKTLNTIKENRLTVAPVKNKSGRPESKIDWELAEKLAALGPTNQILAEYLKVSDNTLDTHIKKKYGITTTEFIAQRLAPTKLRLLSVAIEEAIKKRNTTLMIFMLKNLCGFTDKKEVKQEVTDNGPKVTIKLPPRMEAQAQKLVNMAPKAIAKDDSMVIDTKVI